MTERPWLTRSHLDLPEAVFDVPQAAPVPSACRATTPASPRPPCFVIRHIDPLTDPRPPESTGRRSYPWDMSRWTRPRTAGRRW